MRTTYKKAKICKVIAIGNTFMGKVKVHTGLTLTLERVSVLTTFKESGILKLKFEKIESDIFFQRRLSWRRSPKPAGFTDCISKIRPGFNWLAAPLINDDNEEQNRGRSA